MTARPVRRGFVMDRPGLQSIANGLLALVIGLTALLFTYLESQVPPGQDMTLWFVVSAVLALIGAVFLVIGIVWLKQSKDLVAAPLPFEPKPGDVLTIEDLHKSFGGLKVIDNVSFSVRRGSRTALIGPNGAGKTTIFNLLTGVYPIDNGGVSLDGANITSIPARDRVNHGMSRSFQNIRLMPHLSTVENVMLGQHARARRLRAQLYPVGIARGNPWVAQAEEALEAAGLETFPGQVVAELPYGIQKRIEVVRALVSEPKLLLLDEPAAGLNHQEANELQTLLRQASERGITLLVVEHDMHFVRNLCEHVIVLNFGRKIFEGTPEAVHKDPAVLEAYLGGDAVAGARGAA